MADKQIDRKHLQQQVGAFKKLRPRYVEYAEFLQKVLGAVRDQLIPMAMVNVRPKGIASFAGKVVRRWPNVKDAVNEFTDLAGGRMIVQLLSEIRIVEDWFRKHFTVHTLEDLKERLKPDQFGYCSVHLIVSVDPKKLPPEVVDPSLRDKTSPAKQITKPKFPEILLTRQLYQRIKGLRAEIQIRTIAQHAWSDVGHDRIYKGAFALPADHQRQNAKMAAMIEAVDEGFMHLVKGIKILETNVGAYKTPEETNVEIDRLEAIRQFDTKNSMLACELARLQISVARYEAAIKTARLFKGDLTPALQCCLAQAMLLKNHERPNGVEFIKAQESLKKMLDAGRESLDDPSYLEIETVLAESYVAQRKYGEALKHFAKAFEADASDPRALGGYLREQIAEHDNPQYAVELLRPSIEAAIKRCLAQIAARVNLPFALFHLAEFQMLLKPQNAADLSHTYFGLYALCRAISVTLRSSRYSTAPEIRHAVLQVMLDRFDRLRHLETEFYWITWARRTLMLALSLPDKEGPIRLHDGLAKISKPLEVRSQPAELAARCRALIIAGGCDRDSQEKLLGYKKLLAEVLGVYEGIVICGGTKEGISGIVGELCHRRKSKIEAIGYLPKNVPSDRSATPNEKQYLLRRTDGEQAVFSAFEPIQSWIDLLGSGVHPSQVKLIGINGGKIAGFEYHLAAMLGAGVGVLRESGRQADELMLAAGEPGNEEIHFLPNDVETLRAMLTYPPAETFNEPQMEALIAGIDRDYEKQVKANLAAERQGAKKKNPDLAKSFDISNRMQARHIAEKLASIGKKMQPMVGDAALYEFTPPEIEQLAEMEHGRWVIERTWSGWTLGDRDDAKKRRPQLVPWKELPSEERDKDINAVKAIPILLKDIGFEIVDADGSKHPRNNKQILRQTYETVSEFAKPSINRQQMKSE